MRFGSRQRRRRRREGLPFLRHFRGAKGDLDRGDSLTPLQLLEQSLSNLRDLARFAIGCPHQASPFAPPNVAFRSAKAAPPPLAVNTLSTRIPCVIHRFQTEILTSVSSSKFDLRRLSDARHGSWLLTLERQFTRDFNFRSNCGGSSCAEVSRLCTPPDGRPSRRAGRTAGLSRSSTDRRAARERG